MKNAGQIITTLQHKPQFSKLIESSCIKRLKSSLLPSIQHNIKYGYIKNNTLYFVLTTRLNKLDIDSIINTIKMILNSPMILESDSFLECLDIKIDDVKIYTDPKPQKKFKLFTTQAHQQKYSERATGNLQVLIKDEKLNQLAQTILEIIKASKNNENDTDI
jgi:hypothetical protein